MIDVAIFSVYIEDGCIVCDACEEAAPNVFEVTDDTCFIKPDVRIDGGYDRNEDKSGLKAEVISAFSDDILDAADACPVDVIIVVEGTGEEPPEPEETATPEPEETMTEEVIAEPVELSGDNLEGLLATGDRSMSIMFGSQSGNSEDLASKFAKRASDYGLDATVVDMDGFDLATLPSMKRVLIICSTWGEGDMPDNAEELWQQASTDSAPKLPGVHFTVLALGDTSYEFFCESGKDWDRRFEELGATRLVERVDCDVDYDSAAANWALDALAAMAAVDGNGVFHEDQVEAIKDHTSGAAAVVAAGEDGFVVPNITTEAIKVEINIFRYDPVTSASGKDTWICALPGHMSVLEALRVLKATHDGSLTFRDGTCDDPTTAISVNGRLVLPGNIRLDSVAPTRDGGLRLRIEPLPAFDVIRDLVVDHWTLERKRESAKPWMVAATREGADTAQGVMGTMDPVTATLLHSMTDFSSAPLLHSCSDATPHSEEYLGPSVLIGTWARINDPRTADSNREGLQTVIDSRNGIKAETDLASIRRQNNSSRVVAEALLDARTSTLSGDAFNGRHGKHVWWYTWTVKSSGRVNDTVIYRQVLGPMGLMGNLFSGVTARMVFGFTRTGGKVFNDLLGMFAPPAGIGKMPKQFNSQVVNHHEVVAIFNEVDGRF
ncbi:MAG: flavodoxin domain-containing protein [Candidatus Thalassarchaeum betae]|nr:flavodoxin domain-containing protein [Candidatus Thalassoarchaea betae]